MAPLNPYTYIQCPCSDSASLGRPSDATSPTSADGDEEDNAFDPRAPRANFSLYPLEYLLYCEDCHQIRCPRCITEEIATYFCPSCLFEVPSSNLKSEGNRSVRRLCLVSGLPLVGIANKRSISDVLAAASSAQYALGPFP